MEKEIFDILAEMPEYGDMTVQELDRIVKDVIRAGGSVVDGEIVYPDETRLGERGWGYSDEDWDYE